MSDWTELNWTEDDIVVIKQGLGSKLMVLYSVFPQHFVSALVIPHMF